MSIRVLSFHADYVCRERGACCTSGWPIPIEADRLSTAERAIHAGALTVVPGVRAFEPVDGPADAAALLARVGQRCVFHGARRSARCDLHRVLGHDALPLACRQFPRVSLRHPFGVSVTLSHYCPTAAELLESPQPIAIVTHAPSFPDNAEYVGLDSRDTLPPLLRPDMLMDWDAWFVWEALAIRAIDGASSARSALARLRLMVERARTWTPAMGSLPAHLRRAFDDSSGHADTRAFGSSDIAHVHDVLASIPAELRPTPPVRALRPTAPDVERRFLAAHAFASWTACLGEGLRTWLRSLEAAHALLDAGLTVREADRWLRHLADPVALARSWSAAEHRA
jgi:hypothetical protein